MGKIVDEFRIDASWKDRVTIDLNRDQAERLADVLDRCVDDTVIRDGWGEPDTADLVQDLGAHIRDVLNGPVTKEV
jgi:hypothetical protein